MEKDFDHWDRISAEVAGKVSVTVPSDINVAEFINKLADIRNLLGYDNFDDPEGDLAKILVRMSFVIIHDINVDINIFLQGEGLSLEEFFSMFPPSMEIKIGEDKRNADPSARYSFPNEAQLKCISLLNCEEDGFAPQSRHRRAL